MKRVQIMTIARIALVLSVLLSTASHGHSASQPAQTKKKVLVVSSYHREYPWTQDTNRGFCEAMIKFKYFDTVDQIAEYTSKDFIETSKVIVKKLWMDAKRKSNKAELEESAAQIYRLAKEFRPDLIFLGDDEAGNYIGRLYLDTKVPVVFWGFNDNPVKYGLVDSADRPGHNVTGVYQSGYYVESLLLLKAIVPGIRTFAVLTDETPTGRAHYKSLEYLSQKKELPFTLMASVATNDYDLWKTKALQLQKKVDAFYVAQYSGLKDSDGNSVSGRAVTEWYLKNITIPEASRGHFVKLGMLCAADDSGYKQAFEAVSIAHDIWTKGASPATYPTRTPTRGGLMVNVKRAKALGIKLTPDMGIEEFIDEESVLKETK